MCVCVCVCVCTTYLDGKGGLRRAVRHLCCARTMPRMLPPRPTAYRAVLCAQHVCSTHSTARMPRAQHTHTCSAHSTYAMPPAPPLIHATHVAAHNAPLIHAVQHTHTCSAYNTHTPRALRTAQSRNLRRTARPHVLCAQHRRACHAPPPAIHTAPP